MKSLRLEEALNALKNGQAVIVADDEDRENEGDLICAADAVTDQLINLFAREGRGLICAALPSPVAVRLQLPQLRPAGPQALHGTAFTDSVDWIHDTTTGISCSDRAATLRGLASPTSVPEDFARPGHIFPLIAADGGVLARRGHTEVTVDLCRLAGLSGVGVLCEVLRDDGTMARWDDLVLLGKRLNLPVLTVADVVAFRTNQESKAKGALL